jgi:hypothetical protein
MITNSYDQHSPSASQYTAEESNFTLPDNASAAPSTPPYAGEELLRGQLETFMGYNPHGDLENPTGNTPINSNEQYSSSMWGGSYPAEEQQGDFLDFNPALRNPEDGMLASFPLDQHENYENIATNTPMISTAKETYYISGTTFDINNYTNQKRARKLLDAFEAADLYKNSPEGKKQKIRRDSKVFNDPDNDTKKISIHNLTTRLSSIKIVQTGEHQGSSYRSARSFKVVDNPDYTPGSERKEQISAATLYVTRSQKKKTAAQLASYVVPGYPSLTPDPSQR